MKDKVEFGPRERERYRRQDEVLGRGGQERLKAATVFVAGAGGLGSAVLPYLAAAGVGTIRVYDRDVVRLDNLNRQVLFTEADEGKPKALRAGLRVRNLNPHLKIEAVHGRIEPDNARGLIQGSRVVVDALDNFETRFVLNAAAVELGIPLVHGAVLEMSGQVLIVLPRATACLRCVFPPVPARPGFPVLGAACGVVGTVQAGAVIRLLAGMPTPDAGRLLFWDGRRGAWDELELKRNPACPVCGGKAGAAGGAEKRP